MKPAVAIVVVAGMLLAMPGVDGRAAVEVLRPIAALPAHALAEMPGPLVVARSDAGDYFVLDRRAHTVFRADAAGRVVRRLIPVGTEGGHLFRPSAMTLGRNDILAVLDAPTAYQRIQYFDLDGKLIGIFYLPLRGTPNVIVGDEVFSGAGAMAFSGRTFLVNEPAWGSLFAELDNSGEVLRQIGELRRTGHEADNALHLAFNTGLPVVDPTGGRFFVFQTGVPLFRKFDASGRLVFERHIEGVELDPIIQTLPNRWLDRPAGVRPFPIPAVHTAQADSEGRLWVAVRTGYTYVYDQRGEKIRTVRFEGVRPIYPTSLHFRANSRLVVGPEGYEFEVTAAR
jgi:hypothetical protein